MSADTEPTPSRRGWRLAAPLALAACGILLVTSAQATGNVFRGTGISQMSDLVRSEDRRAEELAAQVSELTAEVDALTEEGTVESPAEAEALQELRDLAGITPVVGPGLTVTLDDAPRPEGESGPFARDDYLVHEQDVLGVISALWAGGAEAMMVAGQRIVSTSFVRCIGPVLLLHGRSYPPPYEISAIGDADAMLAELDESPKVALYRQYADVIGLGYSTEVDDELTLPGYDGPRDVNPETAT